MKAKDIVEEAIQLISESKDLLNPKFFLVKGREFALDPRTRNPIWFNSEPEARAYWKAFKSEIPNHRAQELSTISNPQGYKKRRPKDVKYDKGKWVRHNKEIEANNKKATESPVKTTVKPASRKTTEASRPITTSTVDPKLKKWIEAVKRDLKHVITIGEIDNDTTDVLDYIKTNYRADSPSDMYEKMTDEIYKWYKRGMK